MSYTSDWLDDPLIKFNIHTIQWTYLKPKKVDTKDWKWISFHFATRLKLEGAIYFCRQLLGAASLNQDMGLYLLAHRQRGWYAAAFFFELCSAYDTLLQELNIIYGLDLDVEKVKWNTIKKYDLPQPLANIMERDQETDWFKKVRRYRNTATHHMLIPMEEWTTAQTQHTWDAKVTRIMISYRDEKNDVIEEEIHICEEYLIKMIEHIRNVWNEMRKEFNQDD